MLHLLHPSLSRTAALEPYRFRHQVLAASAAFVALGLLFNAGVTTTLAAANQSDSEQPRSQVFTAAPVGDDLSVDSQAVVMGETLSEGETLVDGDSLGLPPGDPAVAAPAREQFTIDERPPLVYPVGAGAPVGSPFGPRDQACGACSTQHQGIDWNPGRGTPIVAISDGVIASIGARGNSLGVSVTIDHVINGQAITSVYGHMEPGSMPYSIGDQVRVGDQVGRVGSTGVTTAPHLHFELRIGGRAINPPPWLAANGAV